MANFYGIYETGTATVAANATTVTLQNAGNIVNAVRPGDWFGVHKGSPILITAVTATSLTLSKPWLGGAQTAAAYQIALGPYDSGYRAKVQQLLDRYEEGPVGALNGVTLAANTLPYATSATVMATTPLTPFARTILDDSTANEVALTLGIRAAFPRSSPPPSASGNGLSDGDFNTVTQGGTYTIDGSYANGFNGAAASSYYGVLDVRRAYTAEVWQTFYNNGGNVYERHGTRPWRLQANDLGFTPVQQGGGTGQNNEKIYLGTNNNGSEQIRAQRGTVDLGNLWADREARRSIASSGFQRLPGGLLLQWGRVSSTGGGGTHAFPTAFSAVPYSVVLCPEFAAPSNQVISTNLASAATATNFTLANRIILPTTVDLAVTPVNYIAFGPGAR